MEEKNNPFEFIVRIQDLTRFHERDKTNGNQQRIMIFMEKKL